MRRIGDIRGATLAQNFINFLRSQGIEAQIRDGDNPEEYRIWVLDEDKLQHAGFLLDEFLKNPVADKFKVLPKVSFKTEPENSVSKVQVKEFFPSANMIAILTCLAVAFVRDLPQSEFFIVKMLYSEQLSRPFFEIKSGQIWRIFTPIFIHGGWLHLIFNVLWLFQLGTMVEKFEGSKFYCFFILSVAAIANTAQYLMSGPTFMGMSGVIYAFIGFIWMMQKYQAATKYALSEQTLGFMLIWLFICLIGLIPNVANTEHVVGLLLGVFCGYLKSGRFKERRRQKRFENRK